MKPTIEQALAAVHALGQSIDERTRWLCDLVDRDLNGASSADIEAVRWQLLFFAVRPGPDGAVSLRKPIEVIGRRAKAATESDDSRDLSWSRLYAADATEGVRVLQDGLRRDLANLLRGGSIWLPLGDVVEGVRRRPDGRIEFVSQGTPQRAFFKAVYDLLVALGPRFRQCARSECGRYFAANRHQSYCSKACSQRVRTGRFQSAHPESGAERKRAAYVRKRQRTLGPKVKVRRHVRQSSSRG